VRIGISANGKNLEDTISEVFTRASHFIIAEIENGKIKSFEAIKNEAGGKREEPEFLLQNRWLKRMLKQ
jgi:predicted Fe-Mo cluster-binding NifX family protein